MANTKNEPKRLKASQERYVSQQETYRNIPVLHPESSPVDTSVRQPEIRKMDTRRIPEVQLPEPEIPEKVPGTASAAMPGQPGDVVRGKSRAEITAETLGSLTPMLDSFIKYQNKLGEINFREQQTRALLGLPQTPGRGILNLDWRSDEGYSLGMGDAHGVKFSQEYESALKQTNYGVDESANPGIAQKFRNDTYQALLQKYTGENSGNPAFVEAFERHAVKSKIEGDLKGEELMYAQQQSLLKQSTLDSWGGFFQDNLKVMPSLESSNEVMQEYLKTFRTRINSQAISMAETLRVPRSSVNSTIIEAIKTQGETYALNGDRREANVMIELLKTQDTSGYSWTSKKLNSSNRKEALEAIQSIQKVYHDRIKETLEIKKQVETEAEAEAIKMIALGEIKTEADLRPLIPRFSGPGVENITRFLTETRNKSLASLDVIEDPKYVGSLKGRAITGQNVEKEAWDAWNSKRLSEKNLEDILGHVVAGNRHKATLARMGENQEETRRIRNAIEVDKLQRQQAAQVYDRIDTLHDAQGLPLGETEEGRRQLYLMKRQFDADYAVSNDPNASYEKAVKLVAPDSKPLEALTDKRAKIRKINAAFDLGDTP